MVREITMGKQKSSRASEELLICTRNEWKQ